MAVEVAGSFRPDVIISDVVMAGMNGFEAGRLIRQMFPSCRILLFSGQAFMPEFLDSFKSEGPGFEILTKPVEPKVLLAYLSGAVSGFNAKLNAQNAQ